MVGNIPETDIRGANLKGIHSALTLNTGIMLDRMRNFGLETALKKNSLKLIFLHITLKGLQMTFVVHPNLETKSFIFDIPLCRVLLEDNKDYSWIFLVPRRFNCSRVMDLSESDQLQLLRDGKN